MLPLWLLPCAASAVAAELLLAVPVLAAAAVPLQVLLLLLLKHTMPRILAPHPVCFSRFLALPMGLLGLLLFVSCFFRLCRRLEFGCLPLGCGSFGLLCGFRARAVPHFNSGTPVATRVYFLSSHSTGTLPFKDTAPQ